MKFKYRIGDVVYYPVDEGGSVIVLYPARIVALDGRLKCPYAAVASLKDTVKFGNVLLKDLVPISLTQKLLMPFGFKKGPELTTFIKIPSDRRFCINIDWQDQSVRVYKAGHIALDFVYVDYVHELQHIVDDWLDDKVSMETLSSYLTVKEKRKLHGTGN